MDYLRLPPRAETLLETDGSAFQTNVSTRGEETHFGTAALSASNYKTFKTQI